MSPPKIISLNGYISALSDGGSFVCSYIEYVPSAPLPFLCLLVISLVGDAWSVCPRP